MQNSYYPFDTPCNLFTWMLISRNCLVCIDCLVFIGYSVNLLSCPHWLRVTLTIQATFPVICLLNACIKTALFALTLLLWVVVLYYRLSCLHRLRVTLQSCWHICNLFTKCLFQSIALFALTVLFLLVVLLIYYHVFWLRVTLTIQATFPVICSLNTYFKDWLVCISILL